MDKTKKLIFLLVFFSLIRTFELRSKVLTFEKTQISFGFLLTYSYLCSQKRSNIIPYATEIIIHPYCPAYHHHGVGHPWKLWHMASVNF